MRLVFGVGMLVWGLFGQVSLAESSDSLKCVGIERSGGYDPHYFGIHVLKNPSGDWNAKIGNRVLPCGRDVDLNGDASFGCSDDVQYVHFFRMSAEKPWGGFGGYHGPYGEEPSLLASIEECKVTTEKCRNKDRTRSCPRSFQWIAWARLNGRLRIARERSCNGNDTRR
jgi:hypothetical protein